MKTKIPGCTHYSKHVAKTLCGICKKLDILIALFFTFLVLPEASSGVRFEMEPAKVAAAEARMWRVAYTDDYVSLRQEFENFICSQFDISGTNANYMAEQLTSAIVKFETSESNYESNVLPYIEHAYSRLKQEPGYSFDSKLVAGAELDWWVARRAPGSSSIEEVGRLITRFYILLFGEEKLAFDRAGLLRAQASRLRDDGGELCNWDTVEKLLCKSYQALQEGFKTSTNGRSAQVSLAWDPNREESISGYKIYYGSSSGDYGSSIDVGNRTNYTITGLENGRIYYIAITAYNNIGSESTYSEEIALKATFGAGLQTSPKGSTEKNVLQHSDTRDGWRSNNSDEGGAGKTVIDIVEDSEIQTIDMSLSNPEIVWLPQEINLTKRHKGTFPVRIRIEGAEKLKTPSFFPRLKYYIGTGRSYGYFDMINEGDGVWQFDIHDPGWFKFRSKNLHYQVKIFDQDGSVILTSSMKVEFIDSFAKD